MTKKGTLIERPFIFRKRKKVLEELRPYNGALQHHRTGSVPMRINNSSNGIITEETTTQEAVRLPPIGLLQPVEWQRVEQHVERGMRGVRGALRATSSVNNCDVNRISPERGGKDEKERRRGKLRKKINESSDCVSVSHQDFMSDLNKLKEKLSIHRLSIEDEIQVLEDSPIH